MLTQQKRNRATKVFELFLSDNDHESAAAYERLCAMGDIGIEDVAEHLSGNTWQTLNAQIIFEVTDDIPLLSTGHG